MKEKWENFTEEELKEIFENSKSYSEIAQKLGYAYGGTSLKKIKNIAKKFGFSLNLQTSTKAEQEQKRNDIIGKQFGYLTVLSLDEQKTKETNKIHFLCQCNCKDKNIVSVRYDALVDKKRPTMSCGCLQREKAQEQGNKNRYDYTGQKINELSVIEYDADNSKIHNRPYWKCKCSCGRKLSVSGIALSRGQISCGHINSLGEYNVSQILQKLKINFVPQYFDKNLIGDTKELKFDFYLPKQNIIIECQGQQHYFPVEIFGGKEQFKKQAKYDQKKKDYCKSNNIKLIEIPYQDYDKLNEEYLLNLINS